MYRKHGKRLLDLAIATPALVVASPVLIAIAAAVRWDIGAPVLFRQLRPGLAGRPFLLTKFRTMTDERDAEGALLPDAARLTRLGRLLRRTSLDELPELLNVVRGEMSLVGPRPLLMAYLERYSPHQARRHEVKPGLTGLVQVSGRNRLDWETRFALDVEYVDRMSLALDLDILARTLVTVLRANDIEHPGHATMPEFLGSAAAGRP